MSDRSMWDDWDHQTDPEAPGFDEDEAYESHRQELVDAGLWAAARPSIDSNGEYCAPTAADTHPTRDRYGVPY